MFIFLSLCTLFIILQYGVHIKNISLPDIEIKQLYIKWNEKLDISIKEIQIHTSKQNKQKLNYKEINRIINSVSFFQDSFEKIKIKNIYYNNINASFTYIEKEKGFLTISSPDFSFKSLIHYDNSFLNIKIIYLKSKKSKLFLNGTVILNQKNLNLTGSLNVNVNHDMDLNLKFYANHNKLYYKVYENKNIKSTKYLLKLFNMPKEVKYWAMDAIKLSSLNLKTLYGWVDYKHINEAYKNIYLKATANNLTYKYNSKLDAIHTKQTNLEFKNGILYIRPLKAYSSGFFLNKSWLKIDFSKRQELLTLYLLFDAKLNQDMLNILNTYKIKLPFLQNDGVVKTNLKLSVNLRTIDVNARGKFLTKQANFNYLGLNIDIFNTTVLLNNYDIKIDNMLAKYKDIATSIVNVKYNAKYAKGKIKFNVQNITLKDFNLSLKNRPLNIIYTITPKNDFVNIKKSSWILNNKQIININKINTAFDLKKLKINIPITLVNMQGIGSAYLYGNIFLKSKKANINMDILKFKYKNIALNGSSTLLKLIYNKKLTISSEHKIRFLLNNYESVLGKISMNIKNGIFNIDNSTLNIDKTLNTSFNFIYNLKYNKGILNFTDLNITNKMIGNIFYSNNNVKLYVDLSKTNKSIISKELNTKFSFNSSKWKLNLNSLNKLNKYSTVLKKYKLTDGNLSISSKNDNNISFTSHINYPYKIIIKNNLPIKDYKINGIFDTKSNKLSFMVNNLIDIKIDHEINIYTKDIGINIPEITTFYNDNFIDKNSSKENNSTQINTDKNKNIMLNSDNCYLYIDKNRHIISDKIKIQYYNNITTAQLKYKNANAGFKLEGEKFNFYGRGFNDKFMENLFAFSKFKGGTFDFYINGNTSKYSGIFYVNNTIVLDYKILNNILAFINTVPSLITLSLPGYSKTGLPVKSAYMKFNANNDIFNLSDIYLHSKELDILGNGKVNINANKVNLKLNLKTDIGNDFKKLPIVGYVLLGNDPISTTISVKGSLTNPKIKSLIAKDIVVAPLNIIKRTLLLPYHYLIEDKKKK